MEGVDESVPYPAHYEAFYPQTKAEAERLIIAANDAQLSTVALRPHLIWGPGDNHLLPRMIARAKAGQLRRIGSQKKLIDTVHIDNAADAHLLAAERLSPNSPVAGKVYFISQGEPVEVWDMVNRLLHTAGLPPVRKSVPLKLALFMAFCFEMFHKMAGRTDEPRLTRFVVRELSTAHWFNINAARRDLCYSPQVSIEEGLRLLTQ
jgi:nucleoside-diphosphate-sugar epimerase